VAVVKGVAVAWGVAVAVWQWHGCSGCVMAVILSGRNVEIGAQLMENDRNKSYSMVAVAGWQWRWQKVWQWQWQRVWQWHGEWQ
jgi:hypothetical protein